MIDMNKKKNILIVGNSVAAVALAQKLEKAENVERVFMTGQPNGTFNQAVFVDIREDKPEELLSFALENDISLTIAVSKKAMEADVAGVFSANGQMIFAPEFDSAKQILDQALTKKFLYKLKIPTSKFGVFEKSQLALDYIKTANFPLVIKTSQPASELDLFACPTVSVATIAINDLFFRAENKVIIEEFISGHEFTYYIVTDGYKSLPLGVVTTHNFSDDVAGGYLTLGSAACIPDFKITQEIENKLMRDVVNRFVGGLEKNNTPYIGILGFKCVLKDEAIFVQGVSPFIEDADAQVLLATLNENLPNIFLACAMGVFADDYSNISKNDLAAVSVSLFSRYDGKEINGVELLDEPENLIVCSKLRDGVIVTTRGLVGVISANATTLARAKSKLLSEIEIVSYDGMKYRKDILK